MFNNVSRFWISSSVESWCYELWACRTFSWRYLCSMFCGFICLLVLRPGRGVKYCDQFICLSLREHISLTAGPIFTKFVMPISCGHGSVLLWRHCNTLCTSGYIDDVTFGHSGPYGDAWLAALWYQGGVWCLWMPYCKVFYFSWFVESSVWEAV